MKLSRDWNLSLLNSFIFFSLSFMVKVYRRETVISEAEVDAPTPEQALRFVRASVGMPHMPEFTVTERRDNGFSLSPDIGKRKEKVDGPQPTEGQQSISE